jgi:hypothetical protein
MKTLLKATGVQPHADARMSWELLYVLLANIALPTVGFPLVCYRSVAYRASCSGRTRKITSLLRDNFEPLNNLLKSGTTCHDLTKLLRC